MTLIKSLIVAFVVSGTVLSCQNSSTEIFDIYPYITSVSIGPVIWNEKDNSGKFFRVIITTVEIYKHIYAESIVTDEEGYTKKVEVNYEIPSDFFDKKSDIRNLELVEWLSENLVRIRIDERCYDVYLTMSPSKLKVEQCE